MRNAALRLTALSATLLRDGIPSTGGIAGQKGGEPPEPRGLMMSSFMHVHLVALRYFSETVRTGSMRQAAERLHVAASAINRQILKLEDQLQCKLFDRLADGVRLTSAGEVLYHYILRLERDLDQAISQIDDLRGLRRGHVAIACEDGIGRDFVPDVLTAFHRDFPRVTFSVEIASAPEILEQVAEGIADIGIAMSPPVRADVGVEAKAPIPLGVITAIGNPLAEHASLRLRDLAGEPVIHGKTGTGGGTDFYSLITGKSARNQFIETNASDFITNLVKAGLGVGIRSPIGIMQDLEAARMAFIPLTDPQAKAAHLTVYAKPQRTLPIAGAVLLERFKENVPAFAVRVHDLIARQTAALSGHFEAVPVAVSATPH
jgi:DNA-binding transcriptional LysR family regulator